MSMVKIRVNSALFRLFFILICFQLSGTSLLGQSSPFPNDGFEPFKIENPLLIEAIRMGFDGNYSDRIKLLKKHQKQPLKTQRDSLGYLVSKSTLALSYMLLERYQESVDVMQEVGGLVKTWQPENNVIVAWIVQRQANIYGELNYSKEAAVMVDSAMNIYTDGPYQNEDVYHSIVNSKHKTYSYIPGESDSVFKYLDIQIDLVRNHNDRFQFPADSTVMENLFIGYGNAYTKIGDFAKALSYHLENLQRMDTYERKYMDNYILALFGISVNYYYSEDFAKAKRYAQRLIDIIEPQTTASDPVRAQYYNLLAVNYNGLNQSDSALVWLKKCQKLLEQQDDTDLVYNTLLMNIGVTQTKLENYSLGEINLKQALLLNKKDYGVKSSSHAVFYRYLFEHNQQIKAQEKALEYIDSALYNLIPDYPLGPLSSFEVKSNDLTFDALEYLNLHTQQLMNVYNQSPHQIKYLEAIAERGDIIQAVLDDKQNSLNESESLLIQASWFKLFHETVLTALYLLYEKTGDPLYLNKVKGYLTASKSRSYIQELGEFALINNDEVPDSLRSNYINSKRQVDRIDGLLNDLLETSVFNDSIKILNSEKFDWNNKLVMTRNTLREGYPNLNNLYSPIDHQDVILSNYEIEDDATLLVEYFFGEKEIIILATSKTSFTLEKVNRDAHFDDNLNVFLEQISHKESSISPSEFSKSSYALYSKLLAPIFEKLGENIKHLIIIPDEKLTLVPFDLLVRKEGLSTTKMKDLEFLLNDLSVSYQMSAIKTKKKESHVGPAKILGFGYEGQGIADERAKFGGLPGAKKEIGFLKRKFSGKFATGDLANKQSFLENAPNYEILHLALHGQADLNNRFHSSLIFNGSSDFNLKTYDLYGIDFKSQMVVLSACESGVGRIRATEGTFGVGRGFASMGVPTVVTTLWKVNDLASAEIVESFYANLSQGMHKDEAMRQAKLTFLRNADNLTSHPYFWGSFVVMGDTSPIDIKKASSFSWYWLLALVIVIFILSRVGRQPRRSKKF